MIATSPFALDRCPVTGLPVRRKADWTDVPLTQGYAASFCVVGERILVTAPSGNAGSSGVPRFFEARERVLREAGLWERRHVEIKDFGGVPLDHPRLGRAQVTMGMLAEYRRGVLRGFWGYNGPTSFARIMKVAARLIRVDDVPVGFVGDYTAAIRLATAAQEDLLRRSSAARVELERRDLDLDGLRYGFAVLEPGVLLIDVPPRLPLAHIDRFFDHQERLVSDPRLFPGGEFRVVVRLAPQSSASWRVRRAFLARSNALHKRVPCRLCVLIGPRRRMRLVAVLNGALATFGLVAAEDVPQALALVHRDLQQGPRRRVWRPALLGRWPSGEQTWTRLELQAFADELLLAVGSINWEIEGVDVLSADRVGEDNPLIGVYEAIALIKQDFDSILREKEAMQAQVLRAAKLASLGTLTAGMAHELNNPLTAVLGFAQRLARSDEPQTRSGAEVVIRASRRMKAIVDKLLRTSKQEAARHSERVDLNVATREALLLFEGQLQSRGIQVELALAEDLPGVRGDASHLEGLVTNLVTNALDALEEQVGPDEGRSDLIQISTSLEQGWVKLAVTDNGCGMPSEVAQRVFDPFFTTKEVGRGSGLGLYVSHMIAEEYNGSITLRSVERRGTVVEVTFPAGQQSMDEAATGSGR